MKKSILFIIICLFIIGCSNNEEQKETNKLTGTWIADGTQIVSTQQTNPNQEKLEPYYLEFYDDNNFKLTMNDETLTGTYQLNDDNTVYLKTDMTVTCNLNEKELTCNMYATKFEKEESK